MVCSRSVRADPVMLACLGGLAGDAAHHEGIRLALGLSARPYPKQAGMLPPSGPAGSSRLLPWQSGARAHPLRPLGFPTTCSVHQVGPGPPTGPVDRGDDLRPSTLSLASVIRYASPGRRSLASPWLQVDVSAPQPIPLSPGSLPH